MSDSTVTISKSGTYVISGQSDGIQIKIAAEKTDDVHIVLNGVTMTNTNAAISATSAGHVYLTLADGTSIACQILLLIVMKRPMQPSSLK